MANVKIVPKKDWEIIKSYLDQNACVLIPQTVIESMLPEKAQKVLEAIEDGKADMYDFGGEADIIIDLPLTAESYFFQYLFADEK